MKRRDFVAAAAAVTAWPALKAFACPPAQPGCGPLPAGADDVSAAYRHAVQVGKPLLVILVPADDGQKYDRGQLWGEVLNHGAPSTFAALACAEVVCATADALATVVPGVVADSMLFVLVETATLPATSTMHGTAIPSYGESWGRGGGPDWQQRQERERKISAQRIAALSGLIEEAVVGARPRSGVRSLLPQRVAQARAALARRPSSDDDDNAALLLEAGFMDRVFVAATRRLKTQRVRGAKWATASGCGVSVEGENDDVGIACGMGHTPELSRRFLYWFTKDS